MGLAYFTGTAPASAASTPSGTAMICSVYSNGQWSSGTGRCGNKTGANYYYVYYQLASPLDTITWTPPVVSPTSFQSSVTIVSGCRPSNTVCEVRVPNPDPLTAELQVTVAATTKALGFGTPGSTNSLTTGDICTNIVCRVHATAYIHYACTAANSC